MTTPDPKTPRHWRGMTLRDQLREWQERALEAEARVAELEAELAQSQAEVKLRGEYAHDLFRELQAERRLLTEARDLLFHDDLHGKDGKPCPGCALEARIDAARSGAQGEEGDG